MNQTDVDLALVDQIERASLWGWPPTEVQELADGWILRATPGVERGRSCHALTPRTRRLEEAEIPGTLELVQTWSARHGIRGGVQLSPLELHEGLLPRLVARGWAPSWKVWVLVADREEALARARFTDQAGQGPEWSYEREPTVEWLENWHECEPRSQRGVLYAHATSVFKHMDGRGVFGRLGDSASGIAVEDGTGEWAGLFSLVVRPDVRGRGWGRQLVRSLLETVTARRIYLQVAMDNSIALRLYESLGFQTVYSYQHVLAPEGWGV